MVMMVEFTLSMVTIKAPNPEKSVIVSKLTKFESIRDSFRG